LVELVLAVVRFFGGPLVTAAAFFPTLFAEARFAGAAFFRTGFFVAKAFFAPFRAGFLVAFLTPRFGALGFRVSFLATFTFFFFERAFFFPGAMVASSQPRFSGSRLPSIA
jgi:hypothetical protein